MNEAFQRRELNILIMRHYCVMSFGSTLCVPKVVLHPRLSMVLTNVDTTHDKFLP
jgi:hypothetical protein